MPNEILQKIINSLEDTKWLIGVVGTLFVFSGFLIGYIFTSYKKQNEKEHTTLFEKVDKHENRVSKIEGKIN